MSNNGDKVKNYVIALLIFIIVGLVAFIIYDKMYNNKSNDNPTVSEDVSQEDNHEVSDNTSSDDNTTMSEDTSSNDLNVDNEENQSSIRNDILNLVRGRIPKKIDYNVDGERYFMEITKNVKTITLEEDGTLTIEFKDERENIVESHVLDVFIYNYGNGGYGCIILLMEDGTITSYFVDNELVKAYKKFGDLENVVYLTTYSYNFPDEDGNWTLRHSLPAAILKDGSVIDIEEFIGKQIRECLEY